MENTAPFDRGAAALSLACVAHCLALPALAITIPFIAAIAEAEWIHWLLTALSVLASSIVLASAHDARKASFILPAASGMIFLVFALFAENFGLDETPPTVIGGLLLAAAHLSRLFKAH